MKIKEQDEQYLVITSTFVERLIGAIVLVFAIIFLAVLFSLFFPNIPWDLLPVPFAAPFLVVPIIVIPIIFICFAVQILIGKRIVLEKSIGIVTLEAPSLLLLRQKRTIPFGEVNSVEIAYKK